jgi:UDP-glucose 4-epimerase
MSILITGGAGFIGLHLVEYLASKGEQITILDDFSGSNFQEINSVNNEAVKFIYGTILDENLVQKLMQSTFKCYHLAASLGVEKINKTPFEAFEVNYNGSAIVLKAAASRGVKTLIASSSEIYGRNSSVPLRENSERVLGQTNIKRWSYSEAKSLDELYAFELHKNQSFSVTIARFFNTVGPGQSGSYGMVLPRFVKAALSNDPLIVYGDGTQSRTFCSVTDVVDALVLLMDSKESIGQAFNIGSTNEITITELAQKVINLTNSTSEIVYKKHSEVFGDNFEEPQRRVPDISKIKKVVGWQPKQSLDEVIVEIAEYLKANGA